MRHFVPHSLSHTLSLPVSVLPLSLPPCLADGDSASQRCLWPRLVHCWQWRTLLLLPFTLPVSLHDGHIHSTASAGVLHSSPFRASAERIRCPQSVLTMKGMQGCCGETESRSSRSCSHAHQRIQRRVMVSFLLVKVPNEVEPKVEHHDESAAQKMMDEQRTALTAGAQESRFLVEDESCHTPREDLGGVFPHSRDVHRDHVFSESLFQSLPRSCSSLTLHQRSSTSVSPATAHNHMFFSERTFGGGRAQLHEHRAQCMESNVHNVRIADCLAPLQYQRELMRCWQDIRQQSALLFSIAQEPPSSFLPPVMVVFALPGWTFHGGSQTPGG